MNKVIVQQQVQPLSLWSKTLLHCLNDNNNRNQNQNQLQSLSHYSIHTKSSVMYKSITTHASSSSPSIPNFSEQIFDNSTTQDESLDPLNLADRDSCFCKFQGVHIHHKIHDSKTSENESDSSSDQIKFPFILLHGFGASIFSWNRVMKPLAELSRSKVVAFDRPGFGLTSRVDIKNKNLQLNPYSMPFSVMATLYFVDFLAAEKAILIGHSAGCVVDLDSYFEAPERVAALVLVAPAIFAPRSVNKVVETKDPTEKDRLDSIKTTNFFTRFYEFLSRLTKYIVEIVRRMARAITDIVNLLYKKALAAILRSTIGIMLIRIVIEKFGVAGVKNAWYNPKNVTEEVLRGYLKPMKVKGWDKALAEFTAAMLTDTNSPAKPPLSERLLQIKCPVLIITGDTDRLVPSWNAERLSKAIPGSSFEVIKECGHLPQEEKVEEFISIVAKFINRVFGESDVYYGAQPAT